MTREEKYEQAIEDARIEGIRDAQYQAEEEAAEDRDLRLAIRASLIEERLREFQELEDLRLAELTGATPSEGTSGGPNPMVLEIPQTPKVGGPHVFSDGTPSTSGSRSLHPRCTCYWDTELQGWKCDPRQPCPHHPGNYCSDDSRQLSTTQGGPCQASSPAPVAKARGVIHQIGRPGPRKDMRLVEALNLEFYPPCIIRVVG